MPPPIVERPFAVVPKGGDNRRNNLATPGDKHLDELLFGLSVAKATGEVALAQLVGLVGRRDKLEQLEDDVSIRVLDRLDGKRVGPDAHDRLAQHIGRRQDRDRVAVALTHLASVGAHDRVSTPLNVHLRHDEDRSNSGVERRRDIAGDIKVLALIAPDRHEIGTKPWPMFTPLSALLPPRSLSATAAL